MAIKAKSRAMMLFWGGGIALWSVLDHILYGTRIRASEAIMLWFWLFAMNGMYRVGCGEKIFPRFGEWLDLPKTMSDRAEEPESTEEDEIGDLL